MKSITVQWDCPTCGTPVEFEVVPGRQAPACSNPDSPAFSDSGDPAEIDGPQLCKECGREFEQDHADIEQKACDLAPCQPEGDESQEDRIEDDE